MTDTGASAGVHLMDHHDTSKAAEDVIATTDSYGGPVSEDELAEVYLAPRDSDPPAAGSEDPAPAGVDSDPAKGDDQGRDWTDEGGATAQGPATNSPDGV